MDKLEKKVIDAYDLSNGDNTFNLGDLSKYKEVSVQIEWTGLDDVDGVVKMQQKNNVNATYWDDISTLTYTMATTPNSVTLEHTEFGGKFVAIDIAVNSVTTGTITAYLVAKTE